MGFLDWVVGVGFTGWILKKFADAEKEREEEERRVNSPCRFLDGISQKEFASIAIRTGKRFRRVTEISVDGPIVYGTVQTQSGLSEWYFKIDFNDYGHLTGNYWISTDNSDSNIPGHVANAISAAIINAISDKYDNNEELDDDECPDYQEESSEYVDSDTERSFYEGQSIERYNPEPYVPCCFADGISKYDFQKIVKKVVKKYDRIEEIKVFDAKVYGLVRSRTGKTTWRFILDFNDGGHLTGLYRYSSKNEDSQVFISIGNDIKEAVLKKVLE